MTCAEQSDEKIPDPRRGPIIRRSRGSRGSSAQSGYYKKWQQSLEKREGSERQNDEGARMGKNLLHHSEQGGTEGGLGFSS